MDGFRLIWFFGVFWRGGVDSLHKKVLMMRELLMNRLQRFCQWVC